MAMEHVMPLHENYQLPSIEKYREAFVYLSPKFLNELPMSISQNMSLHSFKSALKMHFKHMTLRVF